MSLPESDCETPVEPSQLVDDLLRRQDEVMTQIDALNDRVEALIKCISDQRQESMQQSVAADVAGQIESDRPALGEAA